MQRLVVPEPGDRPEDITQHRTDGGSPHPRCHTRRDRPLHGWISRSAHVMGQCRSQWFGFPWRNRPGVTDRGHVLCPQHRSGDQLLDEIQLPASRSTTVETRECSSHTTGRALRRDHFMSITWFWSNGDGNVSASSLTMAGRSDRLPFSGQKSPTASCPAGER